MRLLIFAVLGYLLYRILRGFFTYDQKLRKGKDSKVIDEMVQDPFCKTYIPLRDAQRRVIGGKEYFFCSKECADKFEKKINNQ
ncbi:MAG TPA: transcriptional regulator [Desulfobacteraceae bacterium]|nr:transcriptional regulator [Desulfobacteraceae bacterium]